MTQFDPDLPAALRESRPSLSLRYGRCGAGLTAEKMAECRWVRSGLVAQFEFVEWTPDNHLRHARFVALRADKNPRDVIREDYA